jgi:hypothetical protein
MELDAEKSKVQCGLCVILIKQKFGVRMYFDLLSNNNVPYCYITPQLVISKNMPHVSAVT